MTDKEYRKHRLIMGMLINHSYDGNCKRREVKCLAVNPFTADTIINVIGTGFNKSVVDCKTCYRQDHNIPSGTNAELDFAVHSEMDLICKCGNKLCHSHVYLTHKPCITCLKMLIHCGVKKILYLNDYPNNDEIYNKILEYHNDVELIKIDMD